MKERSRKEKHVEDLSTSTLLSLASSKKQSKFTTSIAAMESIAIQYVGIIILFLLNIY